MDLWWIAAALSAAASADGEQWAAELARLDLQRAQAFVLADPSLLSRVYIDDEAAVEDAALITDYARKGARVIGASMRYSTVELRRRNDRSVELGVVDQLRPSRVRWEDGTSRWLPQDRPTERVIVLTRTDQGYKISESRLR